MAQQVSLSPVVEDKIVKVLMRKRGIPQDEAELYMSAFKNEGLSDFDRDLARIAQAGPALKGIPASVADPIQSVLATRLAYSATQQSSGAQESTAERMLAIKAALGDNDSGLKKEVEELRNTLTQRDKDALVKWQQDLQVRLETIQKQQDDKNKAILDAIESMKKGGTTSMAGDPILVTQQVSQEMAKLQTIRDEFAKVMGIQSQVQAGGSIEDARRRLTELGYTVKGPMNSEEFTQILNQKLAEKDAQYALQLAETEKRAKQEAQDTQKTIAMIVQGAQSILEVLPTIMGPGDGAKAVGVIKSLLGAGTKVAAAAVNPAMEETAQVAGQVLG